MKKTSIIALVFLLAVACASAGLLEYFGQVNHEVEVEQAVTMTGEETVTVQTTGAGAAITDKYSLVNNANVPIAVGIDTTEVSGISTVYTDSIRTLVLDNKDPSTWQRIEDNTIGTMTFDTKGETFDYTFSAEGLSPEIQYSLIYYAPIISFKPSKT